MPLQARVGRHKNTGAHCQNWVEDQRVVIMFLADIPATEGGAAGTGLNINGLRGGVASEALYQAILRFQQKHFASHQTGFIEPGGPQYAKLEELATRAVNPPAPPPGPGQWDQIKTGGVQRALKLALANDTKLDHSDVLNIIAATLSNGYVSPSELDDLSLVALTSGTISDRAKKLLLSFVSKVKSLPEGKGPYRLHTVQHVQAAKMACDFTLNTTRTAFPKLDLHEVGIGMLMRIGFPGLLRQGSASLCGPAALLFGIISDNPILYARFATDMFVKGQAKLGRLLIKPGKDVREYTPSGIDPIDWLTMASIRDSENWFFDYDTADKEFAGMTLPDELATWFRMAGYSDIRNVTGVVLNEGAKTLGEAEELFNKKYRVCLFINTNMLDGKDQAKPSVMVDHWVVLTDEIKRSSGKIKLQVFTYGKGDYQIPQAGDLTLGQFLGNFYGYVAAKA
jgi:hypothetical protein